MLSIMLAVKMRMMRGALAVMLEMESDLTVVGETDRAESVIRAALRCRPDVVVLDTDLEGGSTIAVAAQVHKSMPACRTLLIASRKYPELVRHALRANASGLLMMDSPP